MRINKFLASATTLSRRAADDAITKGKVLINGEVAALGSEVSDTDEVTLDGQKLAARTQAQTILLNKPVGYVCSRDGQGSKTVYDLIPPDMHHLKPVGRLDKDSSGLLVMTDDGQLANQLTHPSFKKQKVYEITLDSELTPKDFERITGPGIKLEDGLSSLGLDYINDGNFKWKVTMAEGRNRQIRRTFEQLAYKVLALHRTEFGPYQLDELPDGQYTSITPSS